MSSGDSRDYGTLSNWVYKQLRDSITEGRFQAGDCLVELKIAEELGVSRTPVREALKQLELEELVTSYPNRGVVVNAITNEDIEDVFKIRLLLEGQAAAWAAERITPEQLDRMTEAAELMDLYTRKGDTEHLVRLDTRFHEIIYDACQSRTLRHILLSLHQKIHRARQSSLTSPGRARDSLAEHRQILDALERHDAAAAKRCIERHVCGASGGVEGRQPSFPEILPEAQRP